MISTPTPPKPPADFQQVARKIARWSANGLATAIVLAAGLGFGRQVMLWWHETPPDHNSPPPVESLADVVGPRQLEFGDATARLQTQLVVGKKSSALAELRRLVRRAGAAGQPPARAIGPAEARLMAEIAKKLPTHESGQPRLDEFDDIVPTVISTRGVAVAGESLERRVVALGFALPSDGGWTLYAFEFSGQAAESAAADDVPLPPHSRRSLALRQPDGGLTTAFHATSAGAASPAAWQQFFAAELTRRGWQLVGEWRTPAAPNDAVRSAARYSKEASAASESPPRWLEVQFGPDERGQLSGVLTLSASP